MIKYFILILTLISISAFAHNDPRYDSHNPCNGGFNIYGKYGSITLLQPCYDIRNYYVIPKYKTHKHYNKQWQHWRPANKHWRHGNKHWRNR